MSIRFDKPQRNEVVKETTSASQTPKTNGSDGSAKVWLIALLVIGLVVAAAGCDSPRQQTAPAATSSTAPESTYDYSSSSVPSSESSVTGSSSSSYVVYDEPEPVSPYIDNHLSTGTVPYYNDYDLVGDDSQIRVKTSSGSERDVVVIVKCDGVMVRNAYIKAGGSYTFNVPNATYQVFFYYGKGWDPTKKMGAYKTGGFVENESFQKDSQVELEDQELTYSLILTQNGNFSTQQSNKSEMF